MAKIDRNGANPSIDVVNVVVASTVIVVNEVEVDVAVVVCVVGMVTAAAVDVAVGVEVVVVTCSIINGEVVVDVCVT